MAAPPNAPGSNNERAKTEILTNADLVELTGGLRQGVAQIRWIKQSLGIETRLVRQRGTRSSLGASSGVPTTLRVKDQRSIGLNHEPSPAPTAITYRANVAEAKRGVSKSTICRLAEEGEFVLVKIGKRSSGITADSLLALIERNKAQRG